MYEVPRAVKFIEIKSRMVVTGDSGERGRGSGGLMSVEFQFRKKEEFWVRLGVMAAARCKSVC